MRRKKILSMPRQLDLFPEARRPTAKQFAVKLLGIGLVSKTVLRRRPAAGKPRSINVVEEIESAYSFLEGRQGVNIQSLVGFLERAAKVEVEAVLQNKAIFEPLQRSRQEQAAIRKAVKTIARFVNRKKKLDELRKMHAPTPQERAERSSQQRHLKNIGKKS